MSRAPSIGIRSGPSSTYPSPRQSAAPTLPALTHKPSGHRGSDAAQTEPSSPSDVRLSEALGSGRSLKMHSILNPPSHDDRRASISEGMRKPHDLSTTSPQASQGQGRTLPPVSGLASAAYGSAGAHDPARRHCAPPISLPTGTSRSPYNSTASTPLVGTPNTIRPTYGFPGLSATASERRGSDSIHTAPQSLTNSPTTSYSSYVPTQRNSPTGHYASLAPPSIMLAGHEASSQFQGRTGPSSSQSSYQMMTLDTESGPIQVPVDVQAASKMADEKRKRNAGASARFRQRRKEKEREAAQTISRLEGKVREVVEEKEYYRMERDYFRELVYNSPASAHVTPRMPSPKQRKAAIVSSRRTSPPADGGAEWQQSGERGSDDGRNQRRRISGYSEPSPPATSPSFAQHPTSAGPPSSYPYKYSQHPPTAPGQGPLGNGHPHHHHHHPHHHYGSNGPTSYAPPAATWKPQVS